MAMYYDMLGFYYDTLLDGAYYPENDYETQLLENLIASADKAIAEMEMSNDKRKSKYLTGYYISLASILIRSYPDYYDEAADLLDKVSKLIEENEPLISDNHCYYYMVSAWYYTLVKPNIAKTRALTEQAENIAKQVFPADLEIIDISHIPTANCLFYHDDFRSAAVGARMRARRKAVHKAYHRLLRRRKLPSHQRPHPARKNRPNRKTVKILRQRRLKPNPRTKQMILLPREK